MTAKLGSIYRRKKKRPDGTHQILPTWWIKYSKNGEIIRESCGSEKRADAERLLKKRVGEIVTGKFAGLATERVVLEELFQDVIEDYILYDQQSLKDAQGRFDNHLRPAFAQVRAVDFSTQHIKRYITRRRSDGAADATINRELSLLRRAFNLGAQSDPPKVARVPHFEMLEELNVREGFLEYEKYVGLLGELPWYVRPIYVTAYHVGGRRGELSKAVWPGVDFRGCQIKLPGRTTKNKEGRTLPIYGEMHEWLALAKERRDREFPDCPWVFYGPNGGRLYWFYDVWDAACDRAGLPGFLFHDLRRSAVRNMERAGIPRKVATGISGHKTENVYRRYDIVAERDIADAAARLDGYLERMKREAEAEAAKHSEKSLGTPEQKQEEQPSDRDAPNPLK